MTDTTHKKALITGASAGLGLEISRALAQEGYDVALTSRDAGKLESVLSHDDFANVKTVAIELELASEDSVNRAIKTATDELGGIDVLVNNGATPLIKPAIEVTWQEWDRVVDATLKGTYFLTCRFAEHCINTERAGSVINIASTHGIVGWPLRTVYGTAKGGMIQMSRMLAIEWADKNIRVNTVSPATVMTESRMESLSDPKNRASMLGRIPTGRFVEASEIAAATLYFADPDNASVTGQMLVIDGGLTAV
ncbi:MAG: SDR family oxidoreductase [Rhodospirillaceae bacterium]|jgi:NAD(P)-dependent dehydrogenase (short-subunit alcohol dehydrogenase family)|nr:SDR family oxidoreductase [Rhodospirillaceae bacterium]MBT7769363.1 SDR family oxidoreductase [Rhodospirillales bacterium]MBT4702600.1 SDR family oxidoreductase [Rhodospirillaceae bacterium]MBT5036795.1 SDR family oxidoreductase [Rhodospirillaceae bacterium]MBT6222302.1 SDR family oxidoreductase [Rhodospirillaceae bacterium]